MQDGKKNKKRDEVQGKKKGRRNILLACKTSKKTLDEDAEGTHMNKCAVSFVFGTWRSSNARFSVSDLTAALLALYAAFPGGFVIPCFEPVLTITELLVMVMILMRQDETGEY